MDNVQWKMDNGVSTSRYKPAYEDLNVWKKANELTIQIYKITKKFPKDELFGLISQIRRCAVSVPANIVEGYGRRTGKDKVHFCYIARGSLNELECYIGLSNQLGYLSESEYQYLREQHNVVGQLLNGYIKSFVR